MKKIKIYFITIVTLCFFGIFIKMQYAPDTYFVLSDKPSKVIEEFFSCGRFVTGFVMYIIINVLNLNDNSIYFLSYIFAIFCTILSTYRLSNLINKDIKKNNISTLLSILIIINIFSFELFVYIEKGIMMFSILLSILALEQVDKLLESKKIKHFLLSIIYLFIAICSYQGTVGVFVAISTIYIIKYSKTIKEFLLNNIKVASIYGIPSITNFIMVRYIANNPRVGGEIVILESIKRVIEGIKKLFVNTYNIFPEYLFLTYIIGIIVFIIYKLLFDKKESNKTKILKIFGAIYIFIVTFIVTVVPQILQNTKNIWFVARSSYPMASVIGILLIYLFNQFDIIKIEKNIVIISSVLFLIIQLICFINFGIDGYIVNYLDKQETFKIIEQIERFETETGNTITKMIIYYDEYTTYVHPSVKSSGDINIRTLSTNWGTRAIINYYSGRKIELVKSKVNLQQKFNKENWDIFDEKQIILENDTIHLCLY